MKAVTTEDTEDTEDTETLVNTEIAEITEKTHQRFGRHREAMRTVAGLLSQAAAESLFELCDLRDLCVNRLLGFLGASVART